ncbi:MAG: hypothetical protein NTW21_09825 [Verrucomicrobia bacterium]|nr:hypothetical protein [Verrucomicrobiota bacterium]
MSKPTDKILLIPGESGWEIWTGQAEAGFTLHAASLTSRASELTGIPGGDILMFFPVKAITAIPMKVTSEDDSLFAELAVMHAERLGMRPDPMAGQLTDTFVIAREGDTTALFSVHLRPPADGDLPTRGPKEFDISARAFPVFGDCLAVWKEFGRWVFSLSHQGKTVYCQATSVSSGLPDDSLVREIRLAIIQLSLQDIDLTPTHVVLWTQAEDPSAGALAGAFNASVEISPRPAPVLPEPRSKLLPADVRSARRAALRRRNTILSIAAVTITYLGLLGWFGYNLWKVSNDTTILRQKAQAAAPDAETYKLHLAKWEELTHAVDLNHSPVDILYRISRCIPPNGALRLKSAEITATEINLTGEAQQPAAVNGFSLALSKSNDLVGLVWQTPAPNQSTRGWDFVYSAAPPKN